MMRNLISDFQTLPQPTPLPSLSALDDEIVRSRLKLVE